MDGLRMDVDGGKRLCSALFSLSEPKSGLLGAYFTLPEPTSTLLGPVLAYLAQIWPSQAHF